ncbi:MAG: NAD(P)H-hydrate dehydratase [Burkholderiales bacterium]|nr:NAD(P)H-hydrate dehydratase [Burkholderiales bacterium]
MTRAVAFAPVCTVAAIRDIEAAAFAQSPPAPLMQRAGLATAELARELAGGDAAGVLVLAGPGNNGGDALEAAVHLKRWFFRPSVVFAGDAARLPPDAAAALARWRDAGGELLAEIPQRPFGLVIDGLFGIGLKRPLEGRYAALIDAANRMGARVLAVDVPSGLDADTGAALGATVRATHTLTFIALKPGLLTLDGPDHAGTVQVAALGLDAGTPGSGCGALVAAAILDALPLDRPRNFHKGNAGSVAVIGGAPGMVGAALLAGRAALRTGAGKVFLGLLAPDAPAVDVAQPELMMRRPESLLADVPVDVYAVGPGLGQDAAAQRLLGQALRSERTVVLDADGLNLVAAYSVLQHALASRRAATLITPHPAEAARLAGTDTAAVQADRLAAARALAAKFSCAVALKGNGTIVAAPDGRWWVNGSGNPGLASAGSGDVLTGIVASLAAQGAEPVDALLGGVWLHGAAADALAAAGVGPIGIAAGELVDAARTLLNRRAARA